MTKQRVTTISITRRFQFASGHRVYRHEGKCRHLHGHNYVAHVRLTAPSLDDRGRVLDFSQVKALVGQWLEENWDHAMILCADDEEALEAVRMVHGQKLYVMQQNPTAENMADELLIRCNALLAPLNIRCSAVQLEETENCSASVTVDLRPA